MQEKYHGPFPILVPVARHVDLVAVSFIADLDSPVEKACFVRAGARCHDEEDGAEKNRSRGIVDCFHSCFLSNCRGQGKSSLAGKRPNKSVVQILSVMC